ncbi:hypothetical protein CSB11_00585 [Candidatus Campbellbacteria bacterium]|nr:MAG: hypothetical protein CSB11_00585 [Candidatus Campbellbacteria bacterium]
MEKRYKIKGEYQIKDEHRTKNRWDKIESEYKNMNTEQQIITLLLFQFALAFVSMYNKDDFLSFQDNILAPLMLIGFSVISGFFALCCDNKKYFGFVNNFTFFILSIPSICILLFMVFGNIFNGFSMYIPAIVLASLLIYAFFIFAGSAFVASVIYFTKEVYKKTENNETEK